MDLVDYSVPELQGGELEPALSPGGLRLDEITDLIAAALRGRRLAGASVVEFNPTLDVNDITAATVGRLICHLLGSLARQPA